MSVSAEKPSGSAPRDAVRVLLVDDNEALRRSLKRVLVAAGHEVVEAGNGREAIAHAKEADFDLILSDVRMPDMDGVELAARLREQSAEMRMVAATAFCDEAQRARTARAGFEAHLKKPVDARALRSLLPRLT